MRGRLMQGLLLCCLLAMMFSGVSAITCPEGTTLKPKVDYDPEPNGCGGSDTQRTLDKALNPYSDLLTSCCNAHDICFETCDTSGNSKQTFKECNDDFNDCLKSKCNKKSGITKKFCKVWAEGYYFAVSNYGTKYFNADQKVSCTCQ